MVISFPAKRAEKSCKIETQSLTPLWVTEVIKHYLQIYFYRFFHSFKYVYPVLLLKEKRSNVLFVEVKKKRMLDIHVYTHIHFIECIRMMSWTEVLIRTRAC